MNTLLSFDGFPVHATRRAALAVVTQRLSALLASCGGGDPVVAFAPNRVLAFGDENSVITADGHKYTVNALVADANGVRPLTCASNPLWVQQLATSYSLVFPSVTECHCPARRAASTRPMAPRWPTWWHRSTSTSRPTPSPTRDLVTLFVGQNDLLEQYALYPATPKEQLLTAAHSAGLALAGAGDAHRGRRRQGARLHGAQPVDHALRTRRGHSGRRQLAQCAALLMVDEFNAGLRLGTPGERSQVALMLTNEQMDNMRTFPVSYGAMTNVLDAVCDKTLAPTVLQCTSDTLVSGATSTSHLWADDLHLSPNGHAYIGALAANRTRTNRSDRIRASPERASRVSPPRRERQLRTYSGRIQKRTVVRFSSTTERCA